MSDSWHLMKCKPLGSCVHGILQARILEWVASPFSRGPFQSRDQTWVSCTTDRFFTTWAIWEAPNEWRTIKRAGKSSYACGQKRQIMASGRMLRGSPWCMFPLWCSFPSNQLRKTEYKGWDSGGSLKADANLGTWTGPLEDWGRPKGDSGVNQDVLW